MREPLLHRLLAPGEVDLLAALPGALSGGVVASTGCVGNRVYTDVGDDALYVAVPGGDIARVAESLDVIVTANAALRDYHLDRRRTLASR